MVKMMQYFNAPFFLMLKENLLDVGMLLVLCSRGCYPPVRVPFGSFFEVSYFEDAHHLPFSRLSKSLVGTHFAYPCPYQAL